MPADRTEKPVFEKAPVRTASAPDERQVFRLDAEHWAAFLAALNAPPKSRPRLARLLNEPSIIETDCVHSSAP